MAQWMVRRDADGKFQQRNDPRRFGPIGSAVRYPSFFEAESISEKLSHELTPASPVKDI